MLPFLFRDLSYQNKFFWIILLRIRTDLSRSDLLLFMKYEQIDLKFDITL
jgi:hypothetical protein